MNRHAYKRTFPRVGYVVVWYEDEQSFPLRNFGDYQSAAIEFARMVNDYKRDDFDKWIKRLISTYNPEEKYSYPTLTELGMVRLSKQEY